MIDRWLYDIAQEIYCFYISYEISYVGNEREFVMQIADVQSSPQSAVLTKAVLRAGEQLGLRQREMSNILGISEAQISRMKKGEVFLSEEKKDFEIAALLVRLARSLDAIVGGDPKSTASWIRNHNTYLDAVPFVMMQKITGLINVINYLDFRRARV